MNEHFRFKVSCCSIKTNFSPKVFTYTAWQFMITHYISRAKANNV